MSKRPLLYSIVGNSINALSTISPKLASKFAYEIFQKPKRKVYSTSQLKYINKAFYDFEEGVEGIQYYKWGNGSKSIVCLHGWESNTLRWKPYFKHLLANDYTIYSLDAPGHGLSEQKTFNAQIYAEAVLPLLRKHKPNRVLGHSVGGFTSILSGVLLPGYQPDQYILLAPNNKIEHVFGVYQSILGLSTKVMSQMQTDLEYLFGNPLDYYASEKLLTQITCPVTIIHDTDDDILPYVDSQHIASIHSHVQLITTEKLGHKLRDSSVVQQVLNLM